MHSLVHAPIFVELCRTPGDFQIPPFPSSPNATHLPWRFSNLCGPRSAPSPLSLAVCLIPFIPNMLQGWEEAGGSCGREGSLIMHVGFSRTQQHPQGKRHKPLSGITGFWKFQLTTELGGLICTGLKIKPNETKTKKKAR